MPKPNATPDAAGIVRPGELLTRKAAMQSLGVADWGFRELVKKGLPTVKAGRQCYVFSSDVIALFERLKAEQGAADA